MFDYRPPKKPYRAPKAPDAIAISRRRANARRRHTRHKAEVAELRAAADVRRVHAVAAFHARIAPVLRITRSAEFRDWHENHFGIPWTDAIEHDTELMGDMLALVQSVLPKMA